MFEELAYADGSTGWSTMANATSSCFASIYTSDAAKTMFHADDLGIHAGMLGPVGTARAVDDGFTVTGRYQFGSGSRTRPGRSRNAERSAPTANPLNDALGPTHAPRPVPAIRAGGRCAGTGTCSVSRVRGATTTPSTSSSSRRGSRSRCWWPSLSGVGRPTTSGSSASLRVGAHGLRARGSTTHARQLPDDRADEAANGPVHFRRRRTAFPTRLRNARRRDTGARLCVRRVRRFRGGCARGWRPVARAAAADAPGDDVRDTCRRRGGSLRVHVGRNDRGCATATRCSGVSTICTRAPSTSTSTTTRSPLTRRQSTDPDM